MLYESIYSGICMSHVVLHMNQSCMLSNSKLVLKHLIELSLYFPTCLFASYFNIRNYVVKFDFSLNEVCRALHLGLLYLGSLLVLLVYSILYGLTAKESHWLGAITSAAIIILGSSLTSCSFYFSDQCIP